MRKPAAYLFAILVGAIIWFFFQHFKVEGTDFLRVVPKSEEELNRTASEETDAPTATDAPSVTDAPRVSLPNLISKITKQKVESSDDAGVPVKTTNLKVGGSSSPNSIRVASFHLHLFGVNTSDQRAADIVANIVRQFDIVALQGVSPGGSAAVVTLAERAGAEFEAILGAPASVQHQDEQFAYIFNKNSIVADRGDGLYTLGDPDNLLSREPLIGWFRAKAAAANEAFTFTLVNVNTEQSHAMQELGVLDNAMHEIRNDGRNEDDVIMLGCFQAADNQLGELGRVAGLVPSVRATSTDLMGASQTENILFRTPATDEFTGRSGVFHFMRAFNLSSAQAQAVSDYLPVWAEFSIYEGGQRGRIARLR